MAATCAFSTMLGSAPVAAEQATSTFSVTAARGICQGSRSTDSFADVIHTPAGVPGVNQNFRLRVVVTDVSSCSTVAGITVSLPPQLTLSVSTTNRVRCVRSQVGSTTNRSDFTNTADCPQSPQIVNGFLNLNPPGLPGWVLKPSSDPNENRMEIEIPLVASRMGTSYPAARICDSAGPDCTSVNPPGNLTFSAPVQIGPVVRTEQGAYGLLSVSSRSLISTAVAGTVTGELGVDPVLETEVANVTAGDWFVDFTFADTPVPSTMYAVRTCFQPSGGTRTCGGYIYPRTSNPSEHTVRTATAVPGRTSAVVGGSVDAPRARGTVVIMYGTTTSTTERIAAGSLDAARTGTGARSVTIPGLTPDTLYYYKACYEWRLMAAGFPLRLECATRSSFRTSS